jgi:hypothetical protein
LLELTRRAGWSCDPHIFERTWSRIIESTRPLSPFFQYQRHIALRAIACPVVRAGSAVGTLAMLWPRGFLSPARFAELHLRRLEEATAAIGADIV